MNIVRTSALIFAASLALSLPAAAYRNAWEAEDLHGYKAILVVERLSATGIKVERVEQWGELVVAYVTEDDGTTTLHYFDPDLNFARVYPGTR